MKVSGQIQFSGMIAVIAAISLNYVMGNFYRPSQLSADISLPTVQNSCTGSLSLKTFPNSDIKDYLLFYITRSTNAHNIFYHVKLNENGKLNVADPIEVFWVKNENGEKRIPISWFEKTFGYGIKTISSTEDLLIFQFAAYGKRNFNLKMDDQKRFRVYTTSLGRQIELTNLKIYVCGGTTLFPKISKIEVYGTDIRTGIKTFELVPI